MSRSPRQRWFLRRHCLPPWLAVLLVLSGHPGAAPAAAASALQAATVFCHAGAQPGHHTPVLPHHVQDAAVLQAGLAGVHHPAVAVPAPVLPPLRAVRSAPLRVATARAPPARPPHPAFPRGPPASV